MDDGVVARVDDTTFYVSATSTGADGVYQWFTWWNAVWFMDVQFANLTGALAAVNVAGPNAREAMQRVSDDDFSADGFAYLDARHVTVAGVPTLALRIGFVGELGYELHFPSPLAEHVWDTIFETAADLDPKPFGLEPQRILRLEKGHVIVSQDTDSESNLHEAAMPWLVKNDKEFEWIGKWATQHVADRGLQWMLVGFESPSGAMPVEGGQVVVDGRSSGRVTSVRRSAELGKVIGLAIVPNELAVDGGRFDVQVNGRPAPMTVHLGAVLRPGGREGEIVTASLPLRRRGGRPRRLHPVAKSAIERAQRDLGATFEERDGWLVPVSIPGEEAHAAVGIADVSHLTKLELRPAGEPIEGEGIVWYPISPRRALVLSAPASAARSAGSRRAVLARRHGRVLGDRDRRPRRPTPCSAA